MAGPLLEIPLFPLQTVLFPGMALPLHIFEPRYRSMTSDCLDSNTPIGIVLALPESTPDYEIPARVGTLARIVDYKRLPDGRYNLLAIGTQRFYIVEVQRDTRVYLTAQVELLDDVPDVDMRKQTLLAAEAHETLHLYLHAVLTLLGSDERMIAVPEDATDLSYLVATCLSCDDEHKQRMLEITSVSARLAAGIEELRRDLAALERQGDGEDSENNENGGAQSPFDIDRTRLD